MDLVNWVLGLSAIIVNAILILSFVAKSAKDKSEMQSQLSSHSTTIADMGKVHDKEIAELRLRYDRELGTLQSKNDENYKALILEMRESTAQLATLNLNIARFEERQETQWRIITKHSDEIEDIKKMRLK
jgi:hypothetical protein